MLIDLLSQDNYVSFNYKVANVFGLESSIYISEIINIENKAIQKNKIEDGFFKLDRNYLCKRTTITKERQKEIEKNLINMSLLDVKNNDYIKFDTNLLASLLTSQDEALIDNVSKLAELKDKKPKKTKQQAIVDNLKTKIVTNNDELRVAYEDWIEGVYANPKGFLSKKAIEIAQKTVDEFADHDLDVALAIINIATVNGYRDMNWAIEKFKTTNIKIKRSSKQSQQSEIKLSNEVF